MAPVSRNEDSAGNVPRKRHLIGASANQWPLLNEANGKRIYIDSGGTLEVLPPTQIAPVDLAILAWLLPDSRKRFRAAIDRLRPKVCLAQSSG